jgi:hypothetical protein
VCPKLAQVNTRSYRDSNTPRDIVSHFTNQIGITWAQRNVWPRERVAEQPGKLWAMGCRHHRRQFVVRYVLMKTCQVSDVKEIVMRGMEAAPDADSIVRNAMFDLRLTARHGTTRALPLPVS